MWRLGLEDKVFYLPDDFLEKFVDVWAKMSPGVTSRRLGLRLGLGLGLVSG